MRIVLQDGTVRALGTDDTWTVRRSNIVFSNIYDGEQVDDTLEELPEEPVLYCEELAAIKDRMSIPVYVQEELKPVELIRTPAGESVFDLGQNMAGSFRLHVQEPAGTRIHVQVGEVLQGGNFYRDNLRTAKAEYIYISDGKEHILEPRFTFYGYRYAKVEGIRNLKISDFTGLVLYSDTPRTGYLETGDAMLNQLLSNIFWGQKSNFIDVPTDCPQRDERMGWTADTQVFVPTASYMTDSFAFYRKYLYDMRMEQSHNDGAVPNVIPSFGIRESCSVWGDAACIMPWSLYLFYGDKRILEESYGSMKAWMDHIKRVDGDEHGWRNIFHFGDWLALDHPSGGKDQTAGGTEEGFIADVYYLNNARIMEKTARLLGYPEEAGQYRELGEKILRGLREEYFTPAGRCAVNTQTAYVLSLYYDLTENREKALDSLLALLKHKKNKIQTGFVGTPLILQVLSAQNQDRLAYEILHDEEYPGWLYEITLGATTVWERWNSMEPDGSVSSTGMNSFNHYAYGSVGEWMWRTLAGISPVEEAPGFRKAVIRPVPDYRTGYVDAEYVSPAGTYRVKWKVLEADQVELKVEVPFDCEAVLELPYAKDVPKKQNLRAGCYEFIYHTEEPLKKMLSTNIPIGELMEVPEAKGMLTRMIPNLEQLPGSMLSMTLRQVMARYGDSPEMASRFDQLDEMLKTLITDDVLDAMNAELNQIRVDNKENSIEEQIEALKGQPLTKEAAEQIRQPKQTAIYPGRPWRDISGRRIQAHGGALFYEDGTYYWYGENKDRTDGKGGIWTWGIRAYISADLYNWEDIGLIIEPDLENPNSNLFPTARVDRPHIIKCDKTGKYVCWIKLSGDAACFVILQAGAFCGPYSMVAQNYRPFGMKAGDFDIVKDEDGEAYLFMDADHKGIVCMKLSEDFLTVEKEISRQYEGLHAPFCREGVALFEHGGKKYMLTSGMSGYIPNKSDAAVSDSWTDSFISIGNPHVGDASNSSFNSQISQVFKVPGKKDLYISIADRWVPGYLVDAARADMIERGIAAHYEPDKYQVSPEEQRELMDSPMLESANTSAADYVWLPLVFDEDKVYIKWEDEWKIEDYTAT